MRIISGTHKGRHIQMPSRFTLRPTTDYAKSALFNILQNHFEWEEVTVLDLFAGSGALSYEFLSRGVRAVVCVDIDKNYIDFIKKSANTFQFKNIQCVLSDVERFIRSHTGQYAIVFADPPYKETEMIKRLPEIILNSSLLEENGWFILEHGKAVSFKEHEKCFREECYGHVYFSFFKK